MAEYKYQNTTKDEAGEYDRLTDKPATGRNVLWSDNPSKAGAGRGKQGGPTAKELQKYEDKQNEGIYTAEKGKPPSPREMAKGGKVSSASKRADGIATKGKTRGTIVAMCGGGMMKRK